MWKQLLETEVIEVALKIVKLKAATYLSVRVELWKNILAIHLSSPLNNTFFIC